MGILARIRFKKAAPALCAACLFAACLSMPYRFERVDADKLRVIGVTVGPRPEVSPGDTVVITAYFAGNKVVAVDGISLAHTLIWGMGEMIPADGYPVELVDQPQGMPDSARFTFVVRPDVFIGKQLYGGYRQSTFDSTARLLFSHKDSLASFINGLSAGAKDTLSRTVDAMELPAHIFFTARSVNGTRLNVKATFAVKYFLDLPGIAPANNNPDIRWVGICKVPRQYALGFSPDDPGLRGKFTMTYLYNNGMPCDSMVGVDTGFSYFLAADRGIHADSLGGPIDTAWDTVTGINGVHQRETYSYVWFYQNVDTVSQDEDSLIELDLSQASCIEMKPPYNTAMTHFRFWVVVYDQIPGVWNRPRGMCVRRMHGVFDFSPAYRKMMHQ
jgi:hypothetical protein